MSLLLLFGQTGTTAGDLAGTSALLFAQTGALAGAGVLAGTTPLLFGQTGTTAGAAALAGTGLLAMAQAGLLTGGGLLLGTSGLVIFAELAAGPVISIRLTLWARTPQLTLNNRSTSLSLPDRN